VSNKSGLKQGPGGVYETGVGPEVLPEIVKEGPDGEKAIAYTEIIPVLIESIKELKAENEALKDRLASIEAAAGLED
jgi:hypothetical protein